MKNILIFVAIVITLLLPLSACAGGSRYTIGGSSMEPTLHDGQVLTFTPVKTQELKRADIVVAQLAGDKIFIRRLIGMPGETIEIRDGHVLINGQALQEPYRANALDYAWGPLTLKDDEFFILADNSNVGMDSHNYGPVQRDFIKGKYVP